MAEFQVIGINKNGGSDPYSKISHYGVMTVEGKVLCTISDMLHHIEVSNHDFFINGIEGKTYLVVRQSPTGRKYLRTQNDWDEPYELLSLPRC